MAYADVSVIGLVGERVREVQEFLQGELGLSALARSVVVSTSDEPAMMCHEAALSDPRHRRALP